MEASKLVTRLQAVSRHGNGMFGELCGQAATEILRLDMRLQTVSHEYGMLQAVCLQEHGGRNHEPECPICCQLGNASSPADFGPSSEPAIRKGQNDGASPHSDGGSSGETAP